MPKKGSGKEKNTKNKAKHSKLMSRKHNKLREEKVTREKKLKALVAKMHEQHKNEQD